MFVRFFGLANDCKLHCKCHRNECQLLVAETVGVSFQDSGASLTDPSKPNDYLDGKLCPCFHSFTTCGVAPVPDGMLELRF